ncbi:MAG: GrpB family protein [Patescibacteria group bacterium]|nr:GrpB family protein [Patescibacteria group bacterium]MDD4610883.1 GrpB family protein [Patescibacteria group bacterium]
MITEEQQKWLNHLDDTDKVVVIPWDNTSEEKYQIVKKQIQGILGKEHRVEHRGASSLKISGQDEIDIYVPVKKHLFDQTVKKMTELYGSPKSNYSLKRARFLTLVQNKHIDVFVINEEDDGWQDSEIFHQFLLSHPDKLVEYRDLKKKFSGRSTKDYYTVKTKFINEIISASKAEK